MNEVLKEKKNFMLLTWPVGLVIYRLAADNSGLAEHFFYGVVYKAYAWVMSRLTGWLPFSLAELLLIAVPCIWIFLTVRHIVRIVRLRDRFSGMNANTEEHMWAEKTIKRLRQQEVLRLFRNILAAAGIIYLWYMVGCGTNYYRYDFKEFSGLTVESYTTEELTELCMSLAEKANAARAELTAEQADGSDLTAAAGEYAASDLTNGADGASAVSPYVSDISDRRLAGEAVQAMQKLAEDYDCLKGYFPRPKTVLFSRFMSRFEITGVYFPWTVEANVNVDIPDYSVGSVMCHELSHLRGFMREDEANYIAYLACTGSDSAQLRYSGYMLALINAGNRLYADDREAYGRVQALYSEQVMTDLAANSQYWAQFEDTTLSEVGDSVNDAYLKANAQTDGTKSYGRMVDLLLAKQRADRQAEQ